MAYRLEDGEAADEAIRRAAAEQLDTAIAELTEGIGRDPATAVHEARKALKKERSLLRLARGAMKSSERRRENETFRAAGRRLSAARDAEVRVGTLDALANRYAGQLPESTFDAIRDRLSQSRRQPQQSDAREVAEQLEAARERVEQWRLNRSGWKAVKRGLRKSYRRGRRAFKRAQDDPTTERLHDWRKRAKDHWYHLRVLEPIAPHTMQGQAEDAHRLSDLLGDDHDLALLREALVADASELRVDVDSVMALVDHRRGQLQAEALLLGRRVYAEKPKAFLRRVRAYWKAWRAQSPTAASEQPAELAALARRPAVT